MHLKKYHQSLRLDGSNISTAFSSKYLIEALRVFKSSEILISFSGEIKTVL